MVRRQTLADGNQEGMAEKLQDAIRQAMGAPDANKNRRDEPSGSQRTEARADQNERRQPRTLTPRRNGADKQGRPR